MMRELETLPKLHQLLIEAGHRAIFIENGVVATTVFCHPCNRSTPTVWFPSLGIIMLMDRLEAKYLMKHNDEWYFKHGPHGKWMVLTWMTEEFNDVMEICYREYLANIIEGE